MTVFKEQLPIFETTNGIDLVTQIDMVEDKIVDLRMKDP